MNFLLSLQLPSGQEECTKMMAYKQNDVANMQAPLARAFGYYTGVCVGGGGNRYDKSWENVPNTGAPKFNYTLSSTFFTI